MASPRERHSVHEYLKLETKVGTHHSAAGNASLGWN